MRSPRLTFVAAGLVAGCSCGEPVLVLDAGSDAPARADAFAFDAGEPDAPRDVGTDAWEPDAWIPDRLILREYDTSPCAPVVPQPHRPRALPADSTPRVLWTRSYLEIGIEGVTYNAGSVDRTGNLSFDTRLVTSAVQEIARDGTLRGIGDGYIVAKGFYGPTMSLIDGRSAEFFLDTIRVDADPPEADSTQPIRFESLSPIGVDFQELAATSDGGFYAQRASHSALRKYCGDGRLQWELLGIHRAEGMMVEADDSVWVQGGVATGNRAVQLDVRGRVLRHLELPEGGSPAGAAFAFVGGRTVLHSITLDGAHVLVVAREGDAEAWRIMIPLADFGGIGLDARGGVWIAATGAMSGRWQRYVEGTPVVETPIAIAVGAAFGTPAGDDGSFLTIVNDGSGGPHRIGRLLPDGTIAWTLPIAEPFQYMTLDVDGRLYLYGSGHVIAVQTDVLPPSVRGCWQHRCSPRGDNRIEPLP